MLKYLLEKKSISESVFPSQNLKFEANISKKWKNFLNLASILATVPRSRRTCHLAIKLAKSAKSANFQLNKTFPNSKKFLRSIEIF